MTTKSKLFLAFGLLFAGMFVFIIGFGFFFFFVFPNMGAKRMVEQNQKRSAESSGTITSVSQYRSSGDKYRGSTINSTYSYQYEVNGVSYNGEQMRGGSNGDEKKKGLKVKICFDPADPKSSEFYYLEDNKICGK